MRSLLESFRPPLALWSFSFLRPAPIDINDGPETAIRFLVMDCTAKSLGAHGAVFVLRLVQPLHLSGGGNETAVRPGTADYAPQNFAAGQAGTRPLVVGAMRPTLRRATVQQAKRIPLAPSPKPADTRGKTGAANDCPRKRPMVLSPDGSAAPLPTVWHQSRRGATAFGGSTRSCHA